MTVARRTDKATSRELLTLIQPFVTRPASGSVDDMAAMLNAQSALTELYKRAEGR
jgi:hypothetical protein